MQLNWQENVKWSLIFSQTKSMKLWEIKAVSDVNTAVLYSCEWDY